MYVHTSRSGIGYILTLPKVAFDAFSLSKSGIGCMFPLSKVGKMFVYTYRSGMNVCSLSKVGLDVCSHFQKWDWMYVHISKSGIGCMFTLPKVALDV